MSEITHAQSPVLEATGVRKAFPGVVALDGVSARFRAGRVHALLGENGAGKSTLVKILNGSQDPDAGELALDGVRARFSGPRDALRRGITTVHQELTVLPDMSVEDNLLLGNEPATRIRSPRARRAIARTALERVGLDEIDPGGRTGDLSLANQQLIEIARSTIAECRVLILDEPSAVLSGDKLEALHAVVRSIAEAGAAIVYITHLLDEVETLADDVTMLRDGRTVSTGPAREYDTARIVSEMVGRTIESVFPAPTTPGDDIALSVRGLLPRGARRASPVDLDLRRGEIVGLAGLVGSGRSRFLRTVSGVRARSAGTVTVGDTPALRGGILRGIRSGLALVPEERKAEGLVLDLTVAENTTLASLREISRGGWLLPGAERTAFDDARDRFAIKATGPDQVTAQLSGGNQQKVVFAKWLRTAPTVLLLDEPTRGIDVGAKSEIYRLITALAAEGMSILLASSELTEVVGLSHRVLVFREGSLVGEVSAAPDAPERIMSFAMGVST